MGRISYPVKRVRFSIYYLPNVMQTEHVLLDASVITFALPPNSSVPKHIATIFVGLTRRWYFVGIPFNFYFNTSVLK